MKDLCPTISIIIPTYNTNVNKKFPNWKKNKYLKTENQAKNLRFKLIVYNHLIAYRILRGIKHILHK